MLFFMVVGEATPPDAVRQLKIDETLFARIGQNDRAALEELYLLTERTIYAYTLSLLKDPDLTQDIVQETYLKIRAAAHLYKPQGKPLAWMFTIAKNLSLTALRRSGRESSVDAENLDDDLRFSYVTDRTDRFVLETALSILKEEERQILLLHAVSGVRHQEIAKSLGIPLSTALSRYHRALKKLKKSLTEQGISM